MTGLSTAAIDTPAGASRSIPEARRNRHILALDGVRGVAILLVFVFHFSLWATPRTALDQAVLHVTHGLWSGVDLFFVLSGFLITGILLDSRDDRHYFRNFYARRVLRIFPLYYAVLFALLLLLPALVPRVRGMEMVATLRENQRWFWSYLLNIRVAATHSWDAVVPGRLNHFWSLAVEEQFYMIWPLIVLATGRRKLLWACATVTVAAAAVRVLLLMMDHGAVAGYTYTPHIAGYVLLPARADTLAIGAALACLYRVPGAFATLRRLAPRMAVFSAAALAVIAFTSGKFWEYDPVMQVIGYPLIALLSASFIIAALDPAGGSVRRFCELAPLRGIGKYAYAIYIFHYPLSYFMASAGFSATKLFPSFGSMVPGLVLCTVLGFAVCYAIAAVSWHFYEGPILRLGRYFRRDEPEAELASAALAS